jgi:hypothetical protein
MMIRHPVIGRFGDLVIGIWRLGDGVIGDRPARPEITQSPDHPITRSPNHQII